MALAAGASAKGRGGVVGGGGVTPPLSADVGSLSATVELVCECLMGCIGSKHYALDLL